MKPHRKEKGILLDASGETTLDLAKQLFQKAGLCKPGDYTGEGFLESRQLPESSALVCPKCGAPANAAASENGDLPDEHDCCVCAYCSHISQYHIENGVYSLRPITVKEWEEMKREQPDYYRQLMEMQRQEAFLLRIRTGTITRQRRPSPKNRTI